MKIVYFELLLAMIVLSVTAIQPAPASAGSPGAVTECTTMADLARFVSKETDYRPISHCPRVRFTTSSVLKSLLGLKAGNDGAEPMAMYTPVGAEILIGPHVDLTSPLGRSYLVHELVHAHQYENGGALRAPCVGWLEGEAYRVQASYLNKRGLPKDALAFKFFGLLQSFCAQGYHPELTGSK